MFLHHFVEESQHAILDELEWTREDARLGAAERDRGVDDLIALVGAVDGILGLQSKADADYFLANLTRPSSAVERDKVGQLFLKAYRYQYITSGLQMTRFPEILRGLVTEEQKARVDAALAPLF